MSRIFLAGAAGVIGRRLTPLLLAQGHSVWGVTRSSDKREVLRELGALPFVVDVFDADWANPNRGVAASRELAGHRGLFCGSAHATARQLDPGLGLTGPPPIRVLLFMPQMEAWPLPRFEKRCRRSHRR